MVRVGLRGASVSPCVWLCEERAEPGLSRGSWMGYCVGRLRGVQVQLTCF